MATVYLKNGNPKYYARFKAWHEIKQAWVWKAAATGTEDEQKALTLAEEFERVARMGKAMAGEEISMERIQSILEDVLSTAGVKIVRGESWPVITDYIKKYLDARKNKVTKRTHDEYRLSLARFTRWLDKHGKGQRLDWITPQRANDYYNHLLDELTIYTSNMKMKMAMSLYADAVKLLGYPSNPFTSVSRVDSSKGEKLDRMPLTTEEINKVVAYLEASSKPRHKEWLRAVMAGRMVGCRLRDAVLLSSDNIDGDILTYTQLKTDKTIVCPMHPKEWADQLSGISGRFCPTLAEESERKGNSWISREFISILEAAGIEQQFKEFGSGRKAARKSFHSLRHSLRSAIVASGGSDAQADLILGHSSGQGKRYTHSELESMRATLKKALG